MFVYCGFTVVSLKVKVRSTSEWFNMKGPEIHFPITIEGADRGTRKKRELMRQLRRLDTLEKSILDPEGSPKIQITPAGSNHAAINQEIDDKAKQDGGINQDNVDNVDQDEQKE